jgi:hypothetical protein
MTILAAIGLTLILVRSKLFKPIRDSRYTPDYAMYCLQCSGFWVGLVWASFETQNIFEGIELGFQVSAICWLLNEIFPRPTIKPPNIKKD